MAATYVYGVTAARDALPAVRGIGDAELELVVDDELAAVTSPVPDGELAMDTAAIRAHAAVLEAINVESTVLPMRFGVVMADSDAVRADLLDAHRSELLAQLREFDGKVELKLRASYEEEPLMREIVAGDQDIARLRAELRDAPEDATYYGRIRLGELVADAVERTRVRDGERIVDWLAPHAVAVDVAEPTHERIALNASFLVARTGVERFDEVVDEIGRDQAGRLRLRYSGPFPPHSFVRMTQEA